jgi:pimeloyl-ACP methyl ester carboxylesterase
MTTPRAAQQAFVLVHGAWHGGWCYRDVAALLRARGHLVFTPTLTGLGERSHLRGAPVNLTTHIDDIANVMLWEDLSDVVLVGHSYGGMVVTGVADRMPERISRLVYLDAFVPQADGDSMNSLYPATGAGIAHMVALDGLTVPAPPPELFAVTPEKREWVASKCVGQPFACLLQQIQLSGRFKEVEHRRYVLATGWGAREAPSPFRGFYDRFAGDPTWEVRSINTGHDVMVDDPAATAELIESPPGEPQGLPI